MKVLDIGRSHVDWLPTLNQLRITAQETRRMGYEATKITVPTEAGDVQILVLAAEKGRLKAVPQNFVLLDATKDKGVVPSLFGQHEQDTSRP